MARFAAIDIGTNSVLLLVAEPQRGELRPVLERAEITRLGRGVDRTRRLSSEAMEATLQVLSAFATEARALGATALAVSATSAARDAENGAEFLAAAKSRAGVEVEILSGHQEAELSYAAVAEDRQICSPGQPLWVIDIGGGSTELIFGAGKKPAYRRSFDVGSVRLTERLVRHDPPSAEEIRAIRKTVEDAFGDLQGEGQGEGVIHLVGVAGTVTTLYAVQHGMAAYDGGKVHGKRLTRSQLESLVERLCALTTHERAKLPGLQPKRADVIPTGALILLGALRQLGASEVVVSDRGLRWGLLAHRFLQEQK